MKHCKKVELNRDDFTSHVYVFLIFQLLNSLSLSLSPHLYQSIYILQLLKSLSLSLFSRLYQSILFCSCWSPYPFLSFLICTKVFLFCSCWSPYLILFSHLYQSVLKHWHICTLLLTGGVHNLQTDHQWFYFITLSFFLLTLKVSPKAFSRPHSAITWYYYFYFLHFAWESTFIL